MTKYSYVRSLYEMSQYDVARVLGISQPTYATYDSGKTQKVPHEFMSRFAEYFWVNEAWLSGVGATESPEREAEYKTIISRIADRFPEAAQRVGRPEAFLWAVLRGEVVASMTLYASIADKYIELFKYELDRSDNLEKLRADKDNLTAEVARLTAENARLTQRNEELSSKLIALLEGRLAAAAPAPAPAPVPSRPSLTACGVSVGG